MDSKWREFRMFLFCQHTYTACCGHKGIASDHRGMGWSWNSTRDYVGRVERAGVFTIDESSELPLEVVCGVLSGMGYQVAINKEGRWIVGKFTEVTQAQKDDGTMMHDRRTLYHNPPAADIRSRVGANKVLHACGRSAQPYIKTLLRKWPTTYHTRVVIGPVRNANSGRNITYVGLLAGKCEVYDLDEYSLRFVETSEAA